MPQDCIIRTVIPQALKLDVCPVILECSVTEYRLSAMARDSYTANTSLGRCAVNAYILLNNELAFHWVHNGVVGTPSCHVAVQTNAW